MKVQNITSTARTVRGIGRVEAGATVDIEDDKLARGLVESGNFAPVDEPQQQESETWPVE